MHQLKNFTSQKLRKLFEQKFQRVFIFKCTASSVNFTVALYLNRSENAVKLTTRLEMSHKEKFRTKLQSNSNLYNSKTNKAF